MAARLTVEMAVLIARLPRQRPVGRMILMEAQIPQMLQIPMGPDGTRTRVA